MAYVLTLGVAPGYRGWGLASRLMDLLHARAMSMRCRSVFLHVISYNSAAIAFYTRKGFSCAGHLPAFYFINSGRQIDPARTTYDALLYFRHITAHASDAAAMPWLALDAATAPFRSAWGMLTACMPWAVGMQQDECSGGPHMRHAQLQAAAREDYGSSQALQWEQQCVTRCNLFQPQQQGGVQSMLSWAFDPRVRPFHRLHGL